MKGCMTDLEVGLAQDKEKFLSTYLTPSKDHHSIWYIGIVGVGLLCMIGCILILIRKYQVMEHEINETMMA